MSTAEAWTVGRLLTWTADYLKKNGSTSPRLDAEVLLAEARGCERIELYTAFTEEPPETVRASFKEMVRRRAEGTPVAYLVGRKEFYSLPFEINPDVLIPRPETEHLVVEAIDRAKLMTGQLPGREPKLSRASPNADMAAAPHHDGAGEGGPRPRPTCSFHGIRIADVGAGSGAVAIALAKSLPGSQVTALEISPAAIVLAMRNIDRHAVGAQVKLVESDLLAAVQEQEFDLIVSNPPYISEAEFAQLPISVRNFEPRNALVGGPNGTEVIQRLLPQAAKQLKKSGWLLLEISPMIADKVKALLDQTLWSEPTIVKDLAGQSRIVATSRL
jgi:release factor glutamine methyltransferase